MPIGVPLIVGGTLAVIGSGYAFKKVSPLNYQQYNARDVD
jgi:hypothetical protein